VLLTAEDFKHRGRYLNIRNTLNTLFEYGAVPVINENDTVSVEEIKFGDNDQLAAMVTNLMHAELLVLLTVVDGLYDGDPSDPGSLRIPLVETWDESLLGLAATRRSSLGIGGMRSKLEAVRMATSVGENVIIADGTRPGVLDDVLAGREVGTLFLAKGATVPAWKRWIGYTVKPRGRYVVDDGARRAIQQAGRSLLAIGITAVEGEFAIGEAVSVVDAAGCEFARGMTNYNSADARAIAGRRTEQVAEILGGLPYEEVIHRNNLVVTV
jgi:glutamate 5-kinase